MHDGGWWSYIRYDEKQDQPEVTWALDQQDLDAERDQRLLPSAARHHHVEG